MSHPSFPQAALLREFLALARLPLAPQQLSAGEAFVVDGQAFSLVPDTATGGGLVVVHAELGAPPAGREAETCALLLRSNTLLAGNLGPIFGMRLDGTGLLMVLTLPVTALTASRLLAALQRMARAALVWKATHGLQRVGSTTGPALEAVA